MSHSTGSKTVGESRVTVSQLMMPQDANPFGNIHGGTVLKILDQAAAVAAMRHCRREVVTARLDDMSFLRPVHVGNLLTVTASLNHAGRTSMEVGVRVEAEDLPTGDTWLVASAHLVMVALDGEGKPARVPALRAETPDEQRVMEAAEARRAARARNSSPERPGG